VGRKFIYAAMLAAVMALMWAMLSGYGTKQPLLALGVFSVAVSLYMTLRMGLLDGESAPFARLYGYSLYWVWLGKEIVKANIAAVRVFMAPQLDFKPVVTHYKVASRDDVERATLANSITLTPGTVTMEVEENGFLIHALTAGFADQEGFRQMEKRIVRAGGKEDAS